MQNSQKLQQNQNGKKHKAQESSRFNGLKCMRRNPGKRPILETTALKK